MHEAIRLEGEDELSRHPLALMWSGLAAGLSMGFSFMASVLLKAYLPGDPAWHPLVYSLGYAVGFVIVVLGRQQLFTEKHTHGCASATVPARPFVSAESHQPVGDSTCCQHGRGDHLCLSLG